jgi:hypothetical protein
MDVGYVTVAWCTLRKKQELVGEGHDSGSEIQPFAALSKESVVPFLLKRSVLER